MNSKFFRIVLPGLVAALLIPAVILLAPGQATVIERDQGVLAPTTEHRFASRLATRFIRGYHYHRGEFNGDMSERIFEQYLRLLDGNRLYFTAADVADLERYRAHLYDALRSADLEPAFDMFNRYVRRVAERTEHALALLEQGFDFDVAEEY
ncbi:MAG: hypothetical protein LAT56_03070, partial [Wenzhouxiangella sp.]|nr:hypothetical protein [Wenzhouxiangella sp.]